jgi:hypothetical protein
MAKASSPVAAWGKNLLRAFAPAGVSLTAEKMKLPPWMQVASTIGTSFLTHRMTGKGLNEIKNALYSQSRELAGENKVNASKMLSGLSNLKKRITAGGTGVSEKPALVKIQELEEAAKDGKVGVNELADFKRKINELRGSLFEKDLGKAGMKTAKRNLNDVSGIIDNTIKEFDNPEFQKVYSDANTLHGGIAETQAVAKWLGKHFKESGVTGAVLKYFMPSLFNKGLVAIPAAQAYKFAKAVLTKEGYRKAYWQVLKEASNENMKGTAAAIKNFNKKSEKILEENQ